MQSRIKAKNVPANASADRAGCRRGPCQTVRTPTYSAVRRKSMNRAYSTSTSTAVIGPVRGWRTR